MPDSPWLKLLLPLLAVVALWFALQRLSAKTGADAGLGAPVWARVLPWFAAYVAWMLVTNALINWRGPFDFAPWKQVPLAHAIARVLGVGVFGPIAEEMLFRGVLLERMSRSRLGANGAAVATAVIWAVIHVSYTPAVIALIAVAGVLLALARQDGRSIWGPAAMHIVWNLFAIW
jgi:membrane protease YdiL (CAAX protease family)